MVRFRNNARLDPSQVEDIRGRGPIRGLPGGGMAVGGGGLGLIGVILYLVFAVLSGGGAGQNGKDEVEDEDRKSTRLNSSHPSISYAVFCLKKKKKNKQHEKICFISTW